MNKDVFQGQWKQVKGKIKENWGELSDNEIEKINGNYDQFLGIIQEKYGKEKAEAKNLINEFLKKITS